MSLEVKADETDDPQFIELLNSLLGGLIRKAEPQELWIIRIENWFDHKWLGFSGVGTVDFRWPAFTNRYDAALEGFHQDKVTFPPFTSNRVLGQWSYERVGNDYSESPLHPLPHPSENQSSESNLHRRVDDFTSSGCFIWYSSKSRVNGRASVMVYTVASGEIEAWFAAFNRRQNWALQATKGASREDVQQLLTT
jgi:hypothetical protein